MQAAGGVGGKVGRGHPDAKAAIEFSKIYRCFRRVFLPSEARSPQHSKGVQSGLLLNGPGKSLKKSFNSPSVVAYARFPM